jgi:FtsP/CotA-like multicopper oxidase with cupredoxin domain
MDRRTFIIGSLSLPSLFLLKGCGGSSSTGGTGMNVTPNSGTETGAGTGTETGTGAGTKFNKSLSIPAQLTGTDFNLYIKTAKHRFFDTIETNTYCIDDGTGATSYLAPTLFIRRGETISIRYTNNLDEDTTMHNHGMHLPATMDGGVHQVIKVSSTWNATWTVKQGACTNWYHPHLMGKTAEHVYKGLAGLVVINDDESDALDLPKTYGVDDIPLIIQDKVFDASGQLDYSPSMMETMQGYTGDTIMVNGVITPKLSVEAKQIRFRILNGSNARVYTLSLAGKSFKQIATDNAFLEQGVSMSVVKLSPAERIEIVVDFSGDSNTSFILEDLDSGKEIMKITVDSPSVTAMTTMPSTLTTLTKFAYDNETPTRRFTLSREQGMGGRFTINGVSMDKNVINQRVPLDTVEVWEVINTMSMVHNFHIHATHFFIIERDGQSNNVPENERGYKDTVRLDANSSVKLLVKMVDYTTDDKNPYMFHCHILEHEDAGMMGQFVVESRG